VVVIAPPDAGAGADRLGQPLLVLEQRSGQEHPGGEERRGVLVGEAGPLRRREVIPAGVRVVLAVARRGLRVQPFRGIALVATGGRGDLVRRPGAGLGDGAVEPEPVADGHGHGVVRRPQVGDEPVDELAQLGLVEFLRDGRGHLLLLYGRTGWVAVRTQVRRTRVVAADRRCSRRARRTRRARRSASAAANSSVWR
jgi:hypothetical protein